MKPKICFLLEAFYPVVNGAAVQIELLAERLVSLGAEVLVITRRIHLNHPTSESISGARVIRVKPAIGLKRIGKYLMLLPALVALWTERKRYDVIVVCDLKVLGILGVLAAKFLRKTCILRAESCGEMDGSFATQHSRPPSRLKRRLIQSAVGLRNSLLVKSDRFLSISSAITKEFRRVGVESSAIVQIPNAVDPRKFAPANQNERRAARRALESIPS